MENMLDLSQFYYLSLIYHIWPSAIIVLLLLMSKQGRVKQVSILSEVGRPLKYQDYVHFGHKRHYWETPNKNFGFYTSEQMEEQSRRIKTDPSYLSSPYRPEKAGKFIVNTHNPEEVHCCTCHNNPQRYFKNADRCKFCEQHGKINSEQTLSLNKRGRDRDYATVSPHGVDEVIQVSLPRVHHHNQKHEQRCQACKAKNKQRQSLNSPKSALFQQSAKRVLLNHLEGSYRSRNLRKGRNLRSHLQS